MGCGNLKVVKNMGCILIIIGSLMDLLVGHQFIIISDWDSIPDGFTKLFSNDGVCS